MSLWLGPALISFPPLFLFSYSWKSDEVALLGQNMISIFSIQLITGNLFICDKIYVSFPLLVCIFSVSQLNYAQPSIISYFYSIVERADRIERELDASAIPWETWTGRGWGPSFRSLRSPPHPRRWASRSLHSIFLSRALRNREAVNSLFHNLNSWVGWSGNKQSRNNS